jgi:tetratricopeptide (TPR) repeat protein
VHSGRPVLLMQNLGLERWPTWHYAVVVGFDADADRVLLRSGTEARLEIRARRFLSTWDRGGRWAMVVSAPHQPPASARPQGWLRGAAAFESLGDLESAAAAYLAATKRWPEHSSAWTALGNAYFLQRQHERATAAYTQALALDRDDWVARNNLVHTLLAQGCAAQAQVLVARAGAPPPRMDAAWAATLARVADAGVSADHCRQP